MEPTGTRNLPTVDHTGHVASRAPDAGGIDRRSICLLRARLLRALPRALVPVFSRPDYGTENSLKKRPPKRFKVNVLHGHLFAKQNARARARRVSRVLGGRAR